MKIPTATTLALATITATAGIAQAGDNRCVGVVTLVEPWHPTLRVIDDQDEEACRFDPTSNVGKQILRKCPIGTACEIARALSHKGLLVTKIDWVERW
jgi:hypothetical protein